jgi:hypothetical protein
MRQPGILAVGRNKVAHSVAGTAQTHCLLDRTLFALHLESKRPKFRREWRLLVPAYLLVNNPES